jgi:nucleotide-binding universal stress UspA family protein
MNVGGYHRIVVATDFSSCSEAAWSEAQRLARLSGSGSELVLVHVTDRPAPSSGAPFASGLGKEFFDEVRRWAERELEVWVQRAKAGGLEARAHLRVGVAYREIVDFVTDERPDLVVVGTHGRGGLDRAMLGSVSDRVIRLAPCPVLAVREPMRAPAA